MILIIIIVKIIIITIVQDYLGCSFRARPLSLSATKPTSTLMEESHGSPSWNSRHDPLGYLFIDRTGSVAFKPFANFERQTGARAMKVISGDLRQ